jgi:GNAT superfamily N-acetyltransferase
VGSSDESSTGGRLAIREAVPGDGPAIAAIHSDNAAYYVELAPDLFRAPDPDGLAEFVDPSPEDNSPASVFLVAQDRSAVVGYLLAELVSPTPTDRYQSSTDLNEVRLFIHALAVLQACWRRGIAGRLVEAAEEWGRERGAAIVLCDTWLESPVSLPFWEERMGYSRRSVRMRKRLDC